MLNLEQRIAEWRQNMAKASGHRRELLEELEEHLREEIKRLARSGVAEENAFDLAVSKLGAPSAVAAEYDKLTSAQRTWWPVKVARICAIAVMLLAGVALVLRADKIGVLLASHVWFATIGYLLMLAIGGLGVCYICSSWFGGPGPTHRHSLLRSISQFANLAAILTSVAVILGMFWAKENWGRYWAWDPREAGAALIIFWAVLISALECFRAGQTIVVFSAVLGSAITAGAWFGVNMKVSGGKVSPLVIAIVAAHFIVLASVPAARFLKRRAAGH
jgi:hypothetical protein